MGDPNSGQVPSGDAVDRPAARERWRRRHPLVFWGAWLAVGALVSVAVVLFTPITDGSLDANPQPAESYAEAMSRAQELLAADGDEIDPRCRSRVIDQGGRTERAVVLLHGYTNCPQQFEAIAEAYAAQGYSVVVPRLPGHGYADRLTNALSDVTPASIVATGDLAVDIAAGLGQEVSVVGLSGGGTLAAWLAQHRDEVTSAALVAPLVIPKVVPERLVAPVARLGRFTPDIYLWWDGERREKLASPPYAYPRYSLRSLGAFLAVGRAAIHAEETRGEPLDRLVVVLNENDAAVNNRGIQEAADAVPAVLTVEYDFPASLGYRHDLVDPEGENAERLVDIYPVLAELLGLEPIEIG